MHASNAQCYGSTLLGEPFLEEGKYEGTKRETLIFFFLWFVVAVLKEDPNA